VTKKITTRHAKALNKTKELISLLAISMLISKVELFNTRMFASYSKHAKVSNQH
jgi:hypothetical protein